MSLSSSSDTSEEAEEGICNEPLLGPLGLILGMALATASGHTAISAWENGLLKRLRRCASLPQRQTCWYWLLGKVCAVVVYCFDMRSCWPVVHGNLCADFLEGDRICRKSSAKSARKIARTSALQGHAKTSAQKSLPSVSQHQHLAPTGKQSIFLEEGFQ